MAAVEDPVVDVDWQGSGPQPTALLESTAAAGADLLAVMSGRPELEGRTGLLELSIVLADDAAIRPMNQRWRQVDSATDVLSFPMDEGPLLGDVVISVETAARRLRPGDWSLEDELLFLLIHGVLHLLGHDHEYEEERTAMERAEQQLWTALGRVGTLRQAE